jgi:hypothetical protein
VPEAAVDVALVGPDEEPDGYGRLELQTAHRLCPMTHGFQNTGWKISFLHHQMHRRVAIMYMYSLYLILATIYLRLTTMYLLLVTMYLLLATIFSRLATMHLLLATIY